MVKILLLSDVHGNFYALKEVIDIAPSYDYLFYLGDAVDYGPHPDLVIDFISENADIWVVGNHDYAVGYGVDCGSSSKLHKLSVITREIISERLLDKKHIELMKRLPLYKELEVDGEKIFIVHGSPSNPLYGYLYPTLSEKDFLEMLKFRGEEKSPLEVDYLLIGHTHYQMLKKFGKMKIVNPGSVGQPRDGDWRAAYAIFDTEKEVVEFHRVKYPVEKTIADLEKFPLDRNSINLLKKILLKGYVE